MLHDPNSLSSFEDNKVIIPIYVLEEIDNFKKEQSELGRNARQASRTLDELRKEGSLLEGIPFKKGEIQVKIARNKIPEEFVAIDRGADSKILGVALETQDIEDREVIFVTKDINLRIRAAALGLKTVDYDTERVSSSELYTGIHEFTVSTKIIDELFLLKEAPILQEKVNENSFGILTDGAGQSALVRFFPSEGTMKPARTPTAWGIHHRNKEQAFALELLLDDKVKLITLLGHSGTGKTVCALAASLQKVAEEKKYQRLLISRPIIPVGQDIGFLPGSVDEKIKPWMSAFYDNLEFLMGLTEKDKKQGRTPDELFDIGLVQMEPLTFLRGRSISNQIIVLDESQNASKAMIKTLLTRAGEGTKIVLLGDHHQCDDPYLDSVNNGLVYAMNKFKGQKIYGHVTLRKGERSELAELSAKLL